MKDTETQHIKTIHQETEKGIRVCKFGNWILKKLIKGTILQRPGGSGTANEITELIQG